MSKEKESNAVVVGDLQLQSTETGIGDLVTLAKKTLRSKSIKNYLLERTNKSRRKEMGMLN